MARAILLIDHGSRRAAANAQLAEIAEKLRANFELRGEARIVEAAHMELAEPSIAAAFGQCIRAGATEVVAVPCMLSRGRHVTEDIPRLLEEAASNHPGVTFQVAAPLAEQAGFIELLRSAADAAERR